MLNVFDKCINIIFYKKQQFSVKQQYWEFYTIYANTIMKNKSAFVKKVKDKKF